MINLELIAEVTELVYRLNAENRDFAHGNTILQGADKNEILSSSTLGDVASDLKMWESKVETYLTVAGKGNERFPMVLPENDTKETMETYSVSSGNSLCL